MAEVEIAARPAAADPVERDIKRQREVEIG